MSGRISSKLSTMINLKSGLALVRISKGRLAFTLYTLEWFAFFKQKFIGELFKFLCFNAHEIQEHGDYWW